MDTAAVATVTGAASAIITASGTAIVRLLSEKNRRASELDKMEESVRGHLHRLLDEERAKRDAERDAWTKRADALQDQLTVASVHIAECTAMHRQCLDEREADRQTIEMIQARLDRFERQSTPPEPA